MMTNEDRLICIIDQLKELSGEIDENEGHYDRAMDVIHRLVKKLEEFIPESEVQSILDYLD